MQPNELRLAIIAEMQRNQAEGKEKYGQHYDDSYIFEYCTWWFKFRIPLPTKLIRKELDRMERDGLVLSNKSQGNNTKWTLTGLGHHE